MNPSTAVALLNPEADSGRAAELRRPVAAWLSRNAPGVSLLIPDTIAEARAMLTILAPRTRVVLIGGDGTVHAMLPALLKGGLKVGLVPAGRHNLLAHTLGLDELRWEQALVFALRSPTGPVDVGLLETDDTALHFISQVRIDRPSRMMPWSVSVDRQGLATGTARRLLLCNALPGWSTPEALPVELNDGRFDAVVVGGAGRWSRWMRPLERFGLRSAATAVPHCQGTSMCVESDWPLDLRVDGEPMAASHRMQVELLPRALDLAGSHVAILDPHRFVDTTW
ncbi:diacylglycerol/lipid kinase family protein [Sphaerotilus sp.]|uniref:diacylglycerol/lipid kinase family protein n=1 Tax=Sphaerotilus sp. TaxID=2093942 RepID=UPI002ACDAE61|nr:diacylglycerol kinase family protein [Sphaerotilus sp.]MDZ7857396.1 diacylglycerol kinase family protein [Sphaerotilus sp.]